jgi:hypothetical protein
VIARGTVGLRLMRVRTSIGESQLPQTGVWKHQLVFDRRRGGGCKLLPFGPRHLHFRNVPQQSGYSTINADYNIGTIDMSARTTNTMTLACSHPSIYGNWINGTGVTLSGTGTLTFAGRGSQTITSAGRTFTQSFTIDTPVARSRFRMRLRRIGRPQLHCYLKQRDI